MKVLVTGSTGLVGSACSDFFLKKGWEVVGLDNNMRARFFGTPDKYIDNPTDIRDKDKLEEGFQKFGPFDAIIHAAAQPSHDYATKNIEEDFYINTVGTLNLLEATRKYCPKAVFVYISTDKVYGENFSPVSYQEGLVELPTRYHSEFPFDENMELDFAGIRSFFGCSKAAADMYVQEYGNHFGMKTVCFRPGCITGKNHEGAEQHGFLAYLAKTIKEGGTYKIFGFKGKQVRDQIHATDLASACYQFVQNPKSGAVYNIGGGQKRSVSVLEAGEMVAKRVGKPFIYEIHEGRKGDRIWDVHDVRKFIHDYPKWEYKYSLSDILDELCHTN